MMASKKAKEPTDFEAKIKKDHDRKNRDCGHSGPGPIYMLPPVLGYPNHDITRYRNPAFTAAGRQGGGKKVSNTGPMYNPGDYNRFGAKFSPSVKISSRTPDPARKIAGTGPSAYNYDINLIRPSPPKATIKGRINQPATSVGPGPAGYNPNLDILYPTPPSASLTGRHITKFDSTGPGPGTYNPGYLGKTAPSAAITGRTEVKSKTVGPGPVYMPGYVGPSVPAFSIAGRPDPCVHPYIDKGLDDPQYIEYVPHPERIPIN